MTTLTRQQVLNMGPGHELNKLVSVHVMKHKWSPKFDYSTNDVSALVVVTKLLDDGISFTADGVSLKVNKLYDFYLKDDAEDILSNAINQPTLAEAICKAAVIFALNIPFLGGVEI